MAAVVCPECDNPLTLNPDDYEEGETFPCDECGVDLEIKSLDPIEVVPVDDGGYDDEEDTHLTDEDDE